LGMGDLGSIRVKDIVSNHGEVVTTSPDTTILRAAKLMAAKNIGAMPVVDSDGNLVGMISERDIVHRVVALERDPGETLVKDAMTPDPVTINPETTLEEALCIMSQFRLRHLLIVDEGGRLAGIISIRDIKKCE